MSLIGIQYIHSIHICATNVILSSQLLHRDEHMKQVFNKFVSNCNWWMFERMRKHGIRNAFCIGNNDTLTDKIVENGIGGTTGTEEFLKITPKRGFDCIAFCPGELDKIGIEEAIEQSKKYTPSLIVGWISNRSQLEGFIKPPSKRLDGILEIESKYSFDDANQHFSFIEPYPTYLSLLSKKPDVSTFSYIQTLDRKYPNKETCSGFLVEKSI
jgi:hypothetical protein